MGGDCSSAPRVIAVKDAQEEGDRRLRVYCGSIDDLTLGQDCEDMPAVMRTFEEVEIACGSCPAGSECVELSAPCITRYTYLSSLSVFYCEYPPEP